MPKQDLTATDRLLEQLLPFIPTCLFQNLSEGETNGNVRKKHSMVTQVCACAVFDISGFSKLASKLQREESQEELLQDSIVGETHGTARKRSKSQQYLLVPSDSSLENIANHQKRKLNLLNSRHVSRNGEGSEKLAAAVTQLFSHLIQNIHSSGGDIIKFAGDALICIWSPNIMVKPNIPLGHLIYNAILCGFELSTLVKQIKDDSGDSEIHLGMHVSVGAGPVNMISIGGTTGRWEFMTTGRGYEDACNGVDLSKTGEVVVSNEAHSALETVLRKVSKVRGEVLHESSAIEGTKYRRILQLSAPSISKLEKIDLKDKVSNSIPALLSYLPSPVSQSLENLQPIPMRLKEVTVVFVKFNGLEKLDFDRMNLALQCVQRAVYGNDGVLRQFLLDDKGSVAVIVVGFPPYEGCKKEKQGIKIALQIRQVCDRINISVQVGVTTGHCYCGCVGDTSTRCEYAAVGSIVNLAARLMSKDKDGHVYCDRRTMDRAKTAFRFLKLSQKFMLKGMLSPIDVFTPISHVRRSSILPTDDFNHFSNFVGRKLALKKMKNLLHLVHEHGTFGHFTILFGPEGIGKSHFLSKLNFDVENANMGHNSSAKGTNKQFCTEIFVLEGMKKSRHTLYAAWKPIFSKLLHYQDPIEEIDVLHLRSSDLFYSCSARKKEKAMESILYDEIKFSEDIHGYENIGDGGSYDSDKSMIDTLKALHTLGITKDELSKLTEVIPSLKIDSVLNYVQDGFDAIQSRQNHENPKICAVNEKKNVLTRRHTWSTKRRVQCSLSSAKRRDIASKPRLPVIVKHKSITKKNEETKEDKKKRRHTYRNNLIISESYVRSLIESRDSVAHSVDACSTPNSPTKKISQKTSGILADILIGLLRVRLKYVENSSLNKKKSILILIDNGEDLDYGSLDLLVSLAGSIPAMCNIVLSVRNDNSSDLGSLFNSDADTYYNPHDYLAQNNRMRKILINDILRPLASCEIQLKSLEFDEVHTLFDNYCKDKYDGCVISTTVLKQVWVRLAGNMRDCFVYFDNLIKDGILVRSIDGDRNIYIASNEYKLTRGGIATSKYIYSSDKLNTSNLSAVSLFLCQVISVYGVSLGLKTLVSLQLYCMPPIPLTERDISDNLSDLIDCRLLGFDEVSRSYYFESPIVREQLFSSLTLSIRTKLHQGIIQYYKAEFASSIEAFNSVLGHHYEGSRDYTRAIQCYERASLAEYAEGNFRDAIMNYSNLLRVSSIKRKVCKSTQLYRKTRSSALCICTWLAYYAASECHILRFRKSLDTFDQAIRTLHQNTKCIVSPLSCIQMTKRKKLIMHIKSMQSKVEKYVLAKTKKTKGIDLTILKADIFEDFPPEVWNM